MKVLDVYTKNHILTTLFKSRELAEMLSKFDAGAGNEDLKSELFLVLCNQPEAKIQELAKNSQLMFFATGIVQRMIFQKGKFYRTYRTITTEFSSNIEIEEEEYNTEKDIMLNRVEDSLENDLHWVERAMVSLYLDKGSMTKISEDVRMPFKQVQKIMKAARTKIKDSINGKVIGNYVVANVDIVFDVSESVNAENINDILEEAWEYINYRVNGTKVPSNAIDTYIKEIKPIKLKKII
jgi:hypothetical protein